MATSEEEETEAEEGAAEGEEEGPAEGEEESEGEEGEGSAEGEGEGEGEQEGEAEEESEGEGEDVPPALCQADTPIASTGAGGCHAALLVCDDAPYAAAGDAYKHVWAYVPDGMDGLRVLSYFHGLRNDPRVDAHGHPPTAVGNKYLLGEAATAYKQPVVLAPFCEPNPGDLADPSALGRYVDDALAHLRCLERGDDCGGGKYLPRRYTSQDITRLYLSGHSAGGHPLAPSAVSELALSVPTDLWLYDCTYQGFWQYDSDDNEVRRFCEHWQAQGRLGNGPSDSRVVIIAHPGTDTETHARQTLRNLKNLDVRGKPLGTPHGETFDVIEAHAGKGMTSLTAAEEQSIRAALAEGPIVFLWTNIVHDSIPTVFTPVLLDAAAS